jgi:A/G-specific adenine glycosylase
MGKGKRFKCGKPERGKRLETSGTRIRRALRAWYREEARPLPWRTQPSLYRTVVSEFMLQQTQVRTALPYFERWIRELPDFAALARAPEARVLRLWEGLGYYSRARNLRRLAQALTNLPRIPEDSESWKTLPGVGPYTAAAITSIAFGAPMACVDGNVVRVLARLTGDRRLFRDSSEAARHFAPLAEALVPRKDPGEHNQGMMELGATICTKANPQCGACPLRLMCLAFRSGNPGMYPKFQARTVERVEITRLWCVRDDTLLLHHIPSGARRLAGHHELPTPEQAGIADTAAARLPLLARRNRSITRYRITENIRALAPNGRLTRPDLVWVPLKRIEKIQISGPHRRWIAELIG